MAVKMREPAEPNWPWSGEVRKFLAEAAEKAAAHEAAFDEAAEVRPFRRVERIEVYCSDPFHVERVLIRTFNTIGDRNGFLGGDFLLRDNSLVAPDSTTLGELAAMAAAGLISFRWVEECECGLRLEVHDRELLESLLVRLDENGVGAISLKGLIDRVSRRPGSSA